MTTTEVKFIQTDAVTPTPENWRIYNRPEADDQFLALVESVMDHGILEPLTISSDNFILSGHRRHAAAVEAGLAFVPVVIAEGTEIGPMSPEDRVRILAVHNRGSRVKTSFESIAEAMVSVDASEAIAAAENRRANVFALAQTSHEMVEATGGSRRTDPLRHRGELLAAAKSILEELNRKHLLPTSARHIHYKLLALAPLTSKGKKGHPYGTESGDSEKLGKLLTDARSAGLIPDNCIVDETRPSEGGGFYRSIGEYVTREVGSLFQGYLSNIHRDQPAHIEIIVEKNTLFPILRSRVASNLRIPISSARGYLSYPAGCKMVDRFEASGKDKFVIIYVSDHDPEGMDMPAAFKKYLLEDHAVEVDVVRAAVTDQQIEEMDLPPDAEAKVSSSRYDKYVKQYGTKVWELDSMDMDALCNEVKRACLAFMDVEALNAAFERERRDDVKLAMLNAAVAKIIPDIMRNLELEQEP